MAHLGAIDPLELVFRIQLDPFLVLHGVKPSPGHRALLAAILDKCDGPARRAALERRGGWVATYKPYSVPWLASSISATARTTETFLKDLRSAGLLRTQRVEKAKDWKPGWKVHEVNIGLLCQLTAIDRAAAEARKPPSRRQAASGACASDDRRPEPPGEGGTVQEPAASEAPRDDGMADATVAGVVEATADGGVEATVGGGASTRPLNDTISNENMITTPHAVGSPVAEAPDTAPRQARRRRQITDFGSEWLTADGLRGIWRYCRWRSRDASRPVLVRSDGRYTTASRDRLAEAELGVGGAERIIDIIERLDVDDDFMDESLLLEALILAATAREPIRDPPSYFRSVLKGLNAQGFDMIQVRRLAMDREGQPEHDKIEERLERKLDQVTWWWRNEGWATYLLVERMARDRKFSDADIEFMVARLVEQEAAGVEPPRILELALKVVRTGFVSRQVDEIRRG